MIHEEKDEDYESVKDFLGQEKIKFIPLIVQLIVCEESYYWFINYILSFNICQFININNK